MIRNFGITPNSAKQLRSMARRNGWTLGHCFLALCVIVAAVEIGRWLL